MKVIPLRNIKRENLLLAIGLFTLSFIIFHIAYTTSSGGYVYGKIFIQMDTDTFQMFTFLIAFITLIYGVIKIIGFGSLVKIGSRFIIKMDSNKITFPIETLFSYHICEFSKLEILYAKQFHLGKHQYEIRLFDHNFSIIGSINHSSICDSSEVTEVELANKINDWLDNGDKIDPLLF